jgi:nicotinate phosphoribosyltransferase
MRSALVPDFESLTMPQGYWLRRPGQEAVFEMFFRRQPFRGGFSVFAGLGPLLETRRVLCFSSGDIDYLASLKFFKKPFLEYLENFRFRGRVWSFDEGSIIFPQEPLIRVQGSLIECQLIEGLLLNIINFQSLIATKAARVWLASNKGRVMEFGLRRAQGPDGALSAARAAFIGGAGSTSNVFAAKEFGIPPAGTMAHSWVMSYPSEEEAFHAYADIYPEHPVFLIDTYDTLKSGVKNAVKVGRRLAAEGKNFGVRLDSGDIHYLSREVRKILDQEGFGEATIAVSNDLDESIIQTLTTAGAPVNAWGVGTQLVTGGSEASFTGVYKLTARREAGGELSPAIKFSDNPEKTTNPGVKQVWRIKDSQGWFLADVMALDTDSDAVTPGRRHVFWHPSGDYRHFYWDGSSSAGAMLTLKMEDGKIEDTTASLDVLQERVRRGLEFFDDSYKRMLNPHIYKVSITETLRNLKLSLIQNYLGAL